MSDNPSAEPRSPSAEKRARKTSAKSAALAGTSARSVEMVKTIRNYGDPELARKLATKEISLNAAYQETRRRIIEARELGLDVPAGCRIGGRVEREERKPCSRCNGTGREPIEENRSNLTVSEPAKPARRRCDNCKRLIPKGARADAKYCKPTCRKAAHRKRAK